LADDVALEELLAQLGFSHLYGACIRRLGEIEEPRVVIADMPWARADELPVPSTAPVVGLDLGGTAREVCCILLDSLPRIRERSRPNRTVSPLTALPMSPPRGEGTDTPRRRSAPALLVSFGGDDPAGLTGQTVRALVRDCAVPAESVAVVLPPRAVGEPELPDGVCIAQADARFRERLSEYDVVCTSFGMTAFEAAAAGAAPVLLDPTRYHAKLSRRCGFDQCGIRRVNRRRLRGALERAGINAERPTKTGGSRGDRADRADRGRPVDNGGPSGHGPVLRALLERPAPEALLSRLSPRGSRRCPACGTDLNRVIAHHQERSYKRCRNCGLVYVVRLFPPEITYGESYFFEEYRAQYGRSYIEDFDHIKEMGRARLSVMRSLSSRRGSVLDVGCAYGPFLSAAQESGFAPYGIDPAAEAVRYVQKTLGIPAAHHTIQSFSAREAFDRTSFDSVTMWYVIEHVEELQRVLEKISALLPVGGLFAFSTPNGEGISARRNRDRFYQRSPADHYTIWEPSRVSRVLRPFGFRVVAIRVTGHHPERFPRPLSSRLPAVRWCTQRISRAFRLGDTFEVYARKEGPSTAGSPTEGRPTGGQPTGGPIDAR
jgi:2-polyprenyl-3-methyl-5-hydroxy-6-metoxy-1,4-benzoquinol methylase/ribosomal protein S27AE